MDMPGVPSENIEVTVDAESILTVKGERKWDKGEGDVLCCKGFYGEFDRSIQLPEGIDPEHTEANYKDGVLELKVPYRESPKPSQKRIESETPLTPRTLWAGSKRSPSTLPALTA